MLTNVGSANMTISAITVGGANPGDFPGLAHNCASLAPGQSCTASIAFRPTASGTRTATLTVTDTAPGTRTTWPSQASGPSAERCAHPGERTTGLEPATFGLGSRERNQV
jgi:hypothetical protein